MRLIGFCLVLLFSLSSQAGVARTQFLILEPGQLDLRANFNYRSTKYTNSAGDSRTLTGIEQSAGLSFGVWENLTLSLSTSYLDLESQENQITPTGVQSFARSQRGLTNLIVGGLYQQDFDAYHLFYGLSFSLRPEKRETELTRNTEKSNAVSRQNAVIPSLGIAVPLAEVVTVGGRTKFSLQQASDGVIRDRTGATEVTLNETYREGNSFGLMGFVELDFFLHPFFSYEREWIYSTFVSREGGLDYRIPGGRVETVQIGVTLPLVAFSVMPTYTYSKFNSDDAGIDAQESAWLTVGIGF